MIMEAQTMNDQDFVKSNLPNHYEVASGKKENSYWIRCKSREGMRTESGNDDDKSFDIFFNSVKSHFGQRFLELDHNTNAFHQDFVIYFR